MSWLFAALLQSSFLAVSSYYGSPIEGIYPIYGGSGILTIYGANLPRVDEVVFRSETLEDVKCNIFSKGKKEVRCNIKQWPSPGRYQLVVDDVVEDITYWAEEEEEEDGGFRMEEDVSFASSSGNCFNNRPVIDLVRPARISRQAGVLITIEGCNLAQKTAPITDEELEGMSEASKKLARATQYDQTQYAVTFNSGRDEVRCNVIRYYTTDSQIVCTTEEFPSDGSYFLKVFTNGREIGENGFGKPCRICKVQALSNFVPLIKEIEPANYGSNGDIITIKGRIFTDAYLQDRCALDEDEECSQTGSVEEGENYLRSQPRFVDALGRNVGICELDDIEGSPSISLTSFNDGFIRCKIKTSYVGNVNVTFSTTFNGESTSKTDLYTAVGNDVQIFNFQLTPRVDNISKRSGGLIGGNMITIAGGPFSEEMTSVTIGGEKATITDIRKDSVVLAAPKAPVHDECGYPGQKGFVAKVWDIAQSDVWDHLIRTPSFVDVDSSMYEQDAQEFTVHLEGVFVPKESGFYSFQVAASDEGRLFVSSNACSSNADLVSLIKNSQSPRDFHGSFKQGIMSKIFLEEGEPIYLRAEAIHTKWSSGFVNIGALFHSAEGDKQSTFDYVFETQEIEIKDFAQQEVQDISFDQSSPDEISFVLELDGRRTNTLTPTSSEEQISRELNLLSKNECADTGNIREAFRNGGEKNSVYPWNWYTSESEPYCGSKAVALNTQRLKFFDARRYSDVAPIDLNLNPNICFAYKGAIGDKIQLTMEASNWKGVRSYSFGLDHTDTWKYRCWNIITEFINNDQFLKRKVGSNSVILLKQLDFTANNQNEKTAYIDEFVIGKVEGHFHVEQSEIGARPSGYIPKIRAEWTNVSGRPTLRLFFETNDCGLDIPLIKLVDPVKFEMIKNPLTHLYTFSGFSATVDRRSKVSPGVDGNFDLKYKNKILSAGVGWTANHLKQRLTAVFGHEFGAATVKKFGTCMDGYSWVIIWNSSGDKEQIELDNVAVTGMSIRTRSITVNDGGLRIPFLNGDYVRQISPQPKFDISVAGVSAVCFPRTSIDCDYAWLEKQTMTIASLDKLEDGSYKITGTNFNKNTQIIVGGSASPLISVSDEEIIFNLPEVSGKVRVRAYSEQFGYSAGEFFVTVKSVLNSVSPQVIGVGGGGVLTVEGAGLNDETEVRINGQPCEHVLVEFSKIQCRAPALDAGTYAIEINGDDTELSVSSAENISASIADISRDSVGVAGGERMVLVGSRFGNVEKVFVGDREAEIVEFDDSEIVVLAPSNEIGTHEVIIVNENGNSENSKDLSYVLEVSSVLPKVSSIAGGALLTIKGFGFAEGKTEVKIGETDCTIKSVSSNTILCETQSGVKEHIVENGVATIAGMPMASWTPRSLVIALGERVTWRWNLKLTGNETPKFRIQQTASEGRVEYNGVGFQSPKFVGESGEWSFDFLTPGTYFYSSGFIESSESLALTGTIIVEEQSSNEESEVTVFIGDQIAEHKLIDLVFSTSKDSCNELSSDVLTVSTFSKDIVSHSFSFDQTPVVESMSPKVLRPGGIVKIEASGLIEHINCMTISIGGYNCNLDINQNDPDMDDFELETLSRSSKKSSVITCQLEHEFSMPPGDLCGLNIDISRVGGVIIRSSVDQCITVVPTAKSLKPRSGSMFGGQVIEVRGEALDFAADTEDLRVLFGNTEARILSVLYGGIMVIVPFPSGDEIDGRTLVTVTYKGDPIATVEDLVYHYDEQRTPMIDSVTRDGNEITIFGKGFDGAVIIGIGDFACDNVEVSSVKVVCEATRVPAGEYFPNLLSSVYGLAGSTDRSNSLVTLNPEIKEISPSSGSVYGGNTVTIRGLGFGEKSTMRVSWDNVGIIRETTQIISSTSDELVLTIPKLKNSDDADLNVASIRLTMVAEDGIVNWPPIQYTYRRSLSPVVTSCSPNKSISGGDLLQITGSNFRCTNKNPQIMLGGSDCEIVECDKTVVKCRAPFAAAGDHIVEIFDDLFGHGKTTVVVNFNLDVSNFAPISGSIGGGQRLTISGTGLTESSEIDLCGNPCEFISLESGESQLYVCETPAMSSSDSCTVIVRNGFLEDSTRTKYKYRNDRTPNVFEITPSRGQTTGGTEVTIHGNNFEEPVTVHFGEYECEIASVNSDQIVCVTSAASKSEVLPVTVNVAALGKQNDLVQYWYVNEWSNPASWGCQEDQDLTECMPQDGEIVEIMDGSDLLLDTSTPLLLVLIVNGGTLHFDREKDLTLRAHYILVTNGGHVQIGSENSPFMKEAHIELYGHRRSARLPLYGAKFMAIHDGSLEMHGRPIANPWTQLVETIVPGTTWIKLKDDISDWPIGGEIVIASTGGIDTVDENEMFSIVKIDERSNMIKLDREVAHRHLGEISEWGGKTLDMRAEVGLLTRNVRISGNMDTSWAQEIQSCEIEAEDNMFEIQTCFQGRFGEEVGSDEFGSTLHFGPGTKQVRMSNVEVFNAGQAFELGRYPVHFHLVGDQQQSFVKDCAIHHTFNRALTFHGVHRLLAQRNTAFHVKGHGFFIEDGIETENRIYNNLAIGIRTSTSLLSTDIWASGFWMTNPNNEWVGNHAVGGSHNGFWMNPPKRPTGPSFTRTYCPQKVPLGRFDDNVAHSNGLFGLWLYPIFTPVPGGDCSLDPKMFFEPAKFRRFTAWGNKRGAEGVFVTATQFIDFIAADNKLADLSFMETKLDVFGDEGLLIKDSVIIGKSNIMTKECYKQKAGLETPWKLGAFTVDGLKFFNFNETCIAINPCYRAYRTDCANQAQFSNIEWHNSPRKVTFAWEHEYDFHDLDGTLTGRNEEVHLLTESGILPPDKCDSSGLNEFNFGEVNATICDASVKLKKFGMNELAPQFLNGANFIVRNKYGSSLTPWRSLRIVHPRGYTGMVLEGEDHEYVFEGFNALSNLSFVADFYYFQEDDHVIMKRAFTDKIEHLQVSERMATNFADVLSEESDNLDTSVDTATGEVAFVISGRGQQRSGSIAPTELVGRTVHVEFEVKNKQDDSAEEVILSKQEMFMNQQTCVFSDPDCWRSPTADGGNIHIPVDRHVFLDNATIFAEDLIIDGTLEFMPDLDYTINVDNVVVNGKLIIGTEQSPFPCGHSIEFNIRSNVNNEVFIKNKIPAVGKKAFVVYGIAEIYGCQAMAQAQLLEPASAGMTSIVVDRSVTWSEGDEIVIASTSFDGSESEECVIQSVHGNKIELASPLAHFHDASASQYDGIDFTVSAEVGLLNRNIKFIAENNQEKFGARLLVNKNENNAGRTKAILSNIEFVNFGQFGYTDTPDPRYAVAFYGTTEVSRVSNCAFRDSFVTAIGIINSFNVLVENNILHRTINDAIRVAGAGQGNILRGNMVINTLNGLLATEGGADLDGTRFEGAYASGIRLDDALSTIVFESNRVAGVEGFGIRLRGDACPAGEQSVGCPNRNVTIDQSRLNHAHGTHNGVVIWLLSREDCSLVTNIASYRNYDYGFYLQSPSSLIIEGVITFDNPIGILPIIIDPEPTEHELIYKSAKIRNSLIGGMSDSFDCSSNMAQLTPGVIPYFDKTSLLRAPRHNGGFTGFMITNIIGSKTRAPLETWNFVQNHPQIVGSSCVNDNVFASFGSRCGVSNIAVRTNPDMAEYMHPIVMERNAMIEVTDTNRFFIHRPNILSIMSEEKMQCGDMDCDGGKKVLIYDDGSTSGRGFPVTMVAQSDFEWNGDPRRGLGDYRIPFSMLTEDDGTKKMLLCGHQIRHELVVFESLDKDTTDRRIGPLGVRSDTGYIDLINGPGSYKGDHGYASVDRPSLYHTILAADHHYEVAFTGTLPLTNRIIMPMADDDDFITISLFVGRMQRIEVYRGGMLVRPTNAQLDKGGSFTYMFPDPRFIPNIDDGVLLQHGANYFDRNAMTLHLAIRGNEDLVLKTSQTLIINMDTVMEMTPEELYSQKSLGPILASILGVSDKNVKVVNIGQSSTRRRRSIGSNAAKLTFEVGSMASMGGPTARSMGFNDDLDMESLNDLQRKIIEAKTVCTIKSEMKEKLNLEVVQISVNGVDQEEHVVHDDMRSEDVFNPFDGMSSKTVSMPTDLSIFRQPELELKIGETFATQPWLQVLDENGARVVVNGLSISVKLVSADTQVQEISRKQFRKTAKKNRSEKDVINSVHGVVLTGQTTVTVDQDGLAKFTDLGVSGAYTGSGEIALEFFLDGSGMQICGMGTLSMIKRSGIIDIKDETSNAVHCTKGMARASDFLRKKKKGGGEFVSCANLELSGLKSIIQDLHVGNFIRLRTNGDEVSTIRKEQIASLSLANNNLSDGEELRELLSHLRALTNLNLANNQFTEFPSDLFSQNRALANFDFKGNPTTTLPPGFFSMKITKKSKFMMSCSLQTIPVDVLLDKKIVKSFLKAAKFC
ncbi:Oidioi.mRNA.OKI2018_I69.XSR.g14489.t2.cds [Oikopleura dioica]|uniref:Oidioi.mRNA.OKI2018_I69.XSR.g14489.t2.cds n=1 Tax=Oikopleura dioica TaxID=34765 RepID=A0ABN7S9X9_OIKDI|nr:Oidioi.mRNA.OKI2018_I69.XSR.g14489.t2.cds [Oikopleura dioica]